MRKPAEIKFEFQEIALEDAQNLSKAGRGRYAALRLQLLERLPKLAPDKAFAFGVGNGVRLDDKELQNLVRGLSVTLTKAGTGWRVIYSSAKKLFVCVPGESGRAKARQTERPLSKFENDVFQLKSKGMGATDIAKQLGKSKAHFYATISRIRNKGIKI